MVETAVKTLILKSVFLQNNSVKNAIERPERTIGIIYRGLGQLLWLECVVMETILGFMLKIRSDLIHYTGMLDFVVPWR